jgi:hypothetical protein
VLSVIFAGAKKLPEQNRDVLSVIFAGVRRSGDDCTNLKNDKK